MAEGRLSGKTTMSKVKKHLSDGNLHVTLKIMFYIMLNSLVNIAFSVYSCDLESASFPYRSGLPANFSSILPDK